MMANVNKVKARKIRKLELTDIQALGEVKENKEVKDTRVSVSKKKVETRKIRMSLTKAEEKKIDKEIEMGDNMSIGVIVLILAVCFVVGIALGYFLYKIAINGAL